MRVVHNRVLQLLALVILVGTVFAGTSQAAPTIFLRPAFQTIPVSGTASLDVVLQGIMGTSNADTVGGFTLQLLFNNSILTGSGFAEDPADVMGPGSFDPTFGGNGFSGNTLDLSWAAGSLNPGAAEFTAAGSVNGWTLATVTFTGSNAGLAHVSLNQYTLSNNDGTGNVAAIQGNDADVCVGAVGSCTGTPVPEPSSVSLMFVGVAGLAALMVMRRRLLTQV